MTQSILPGKFMKDKFEQIVEGVSIDRQGSVRVAEGMQQDLCELAISLQEITTHPVDVEHVLAAVVMAVRDGKLERASTLTNESQEINAVIARYVNILFARHGGKVTPE